MRVFTPPLVALSPDGPAPYDNPAYFPPGIQNLPPVGARPTASPPIANPLTLERPLPVRDAHRYAFIIEFTNIPAAGAADSVIALQAPVGLRNYLMLRNTDAAVTMFISFGNKASANSPLALAPGQIVLFADVVPQNDMYTFATGAATAPLAVAYSNIPLIT